ncbi:MAG: DUF6465 family protein [Clostridiales bacterium]|nr:DUF6465 family protein [Clostridiales bacterium]
MEKKTTAKLEGTKATGKVAAAKGEEKKEVVKEVPAEKKTEEAKTAATKSLAEKTKEKVKKATRTAKKKDELKPEIFIQFQGHESVVEAFLEKAKEAYVAEGHRASSMKSLKLYIKPEEAAVYYVINQKFEGRLDLF